MNNLTNDKTTNYEIDTRPEKSVSEKIAELLKGIHPSIQLRILEKESMRIRKANSVRINLDQMKAAFKYPKMR